MRTSTRGRAASRFRYSPLVAALACVLAPQASLAATFTVTNTGDFGTGTLRQAMQDANASCNTDPNVTIAFNLGSGPFTISPSSALPTITSCFNGQLNVTIDGYSQLGSAPNIAATSFNAVIPIVIDGSFTYGGCTFNTDDFSYGGSLLTLRGLNIRNFNSGSAICGAVKLGGNRITNNSSPLQINQPGAVGGPALADRNVISNNAGTAIEVFYGGTVEVRNNLIGTDDSGNAAAGNQGAIYFEGSDGVIANNVVSGNAFGIGIFGTAGVNVQNNMIGTNASGTAAIPNQVYGVEVRCPVGPGIDILSNVIAGNQYGGIYFEGVNNGQIANNKIGVGIDGTTAMGNGGPGITLDFNICGAFAMSKAAKAFQLGGSNSNFISNNVIAHNQGDGVGIYSGGDNVLNANTIHSNSGNGVQILTSDNELNGGAVRNNAGFGVNVGSQNVAGNSFLGASIHSNGNKNINLDIYGGPLPNDVGDADIGANNLQNFPVISLVTQSGGNTHVTWSLNSAPGTPFIVELFSNTGATAPAGMTPLASPNVSTDGSGNYSETTTIAGLHDFISATATNMTTSDTSEFSAIVALTATPGVAVSPTAFAFGSVPTGAASPSKTATVTSTGGAPYQITLLEGGGSCYGGPPAPPPMCYGGEFTCTTTCATGSPYSTGQSCTITATFAPTFLGPQSASIFICDNATGSPRTITLTGEGVPPPPLQITPSQHDFGGVLVGARSAVQRFRLTNPSSGPQPISRIATTTAFRLAANTCPAELPGGGSCDVDVVFEPAAAGTFAGSLDVELGGGAVLAAGGKAGKARKVAVTTTVSAQLAGRGVAQGALSMPTGVDLGTYTLGSAPLETLVTLTNTGRTQLALTNIVISGPFTLVNECPATLAAGASCQLRIGFSATTQGEFNGTLSVVTDASGSSRVIPVTARSQPVPLPLLRVTPTTIAFGERMAGTVSDAQRITINNIGGAPASLTTMLTGPHFLVTGSTCGPVLAAQTTCFADIAFQPNAFGTRQAMFFVGSDAAGSPFTVDLSGVGCRPFVASANRSGSSRPNCAP